MNIETVEVCLRNILHELQALVKHKLSFDGTDFTYNVRGVNKMVVVETPRFSFDPYTSLHEYRNSNDRLIKMYSTLDGLIDLLYYIHFCLSKYIEPSKRSSYMNMVQEFVYGSRIEGAPEIKHSFMWKMFLSEMFEMAIAFTDDWKNFVGECVTMQRTIDVREQLFIVEDSIIKCANYLGINTDAFQSAFSIVHDANMAKRFPDGTFHRDSIGKIIKPPGWVEADLTYICEALI